MADNVPRQNQLTVLEEATAYLATLAGGVTSQTAATASLAEIAGDTNYLAEISTDTNYLSQATTYLGTIAGGVTSQAQATTYLGEIAGGTSSLKLAAGELVLGKVSGSTPRVTATLTRAADATQYGIGDIIANSTTAASVVPITFTVARISGGSGRITGCRCTVEAASGTIVLPAFDLLLFRPETGIPFAAAGYPADNAVLNVSAAAMRDLVAVMSFSSSAWRNQAGGLTAAGPAIYQSVLLSSGRPFAPFNLASIPSTTVLGILQAQNTWNPGAVVQTIHFALDVDQD